MAKRSHYRWQNEKKATRDQPAYKRPQPASTEVVAWWMIPAHEGTQCTTCAMRQPVGHAIAYNHQSKLKMCMECAAGKGIHPRPSKRMLAKNQLPATTKRAKAKKRKAKRPSRNGELATAMAAMKRRNASRITQPKGPPGTMLKMYELVSLHPLKYRPLNDETPEP